MYEEAEGKIKQIMSKESALAKDAASE